MIKSKILSFALLLALFHVPAQAEYVLKDQYIVKYRSNLALRLKNDHTTYEDPYKVIEYRSGGTAALALRSPRDTADQMVEYQEEEDKCPEILKNGAVSCTPNYVYKVNFQSSASASNPLLWGVQTFPGSGAESSAINQGDEVIVAVVDTGIDYNHEALAGRFWINQGEIAGNGVDDDGNGYVDDMYGINQTIGGNPGDPMDDNGHGTHVAGSIVGLKPGLSYAPGVAPGAKVLAAKFLDRHGYGSLGGALACLRYIINAKKSGVNISVVNNSWGGGSDEAPLREAIQEISDLGMIFVAAAGNSGTNNDDKPEYPASYKIENVVSVAASDRNGNLGSFSNYGNSVHISAPGVNIFSSIPGNRYGINSGTSMAAPHISGALARIIGEHGLNLTNSSVATQAVNLLYNNYSNAVVTLDGIVDGGRMLNLDSSSQVRDSCLTNGSCEPKVRRIKFTDPQSKKSLRSINARSRVMLEVEGSGNGEVELMIRSGFGNCDAVKVKMENGLASKIISIPTHAVYERFVRFYNAERVTGSARIVGSADLKLLYSLRADRRKSTRVHRSFCANVRRSR